jgi:Cu/Ag efflux protein CusF
MKLYLRWTAAVLALVMVALMMGCGGEPKAQVKSYAMRGVVQKLDPAAKVATIQHEKIGDWMEAMTMDFPVREATEFAKLKVGDKITATVFVQDPDYWIGEIKPQP